MIDRRSFLTLIGGTAASTALPSNASASQRGNALRIVIVGAGVAGVRTAMRLQQSCNGVDVTLIDPQIFCEAASRDKINNALMLDTPAVAVTTGVNAIAQRVVEVDPVSRRVRLEDNSYVQGDMLVLAPGVDFKYDAGDVHPLNESMLLSRIDAMAQGATIVIGIPEAPYQYPQGPYVQVTRMAKYLRLHNPTARILVLDHNAGSSLAELYRWQWRKGTAPQMIEHLAVRRGYIRDTQPGRLVTADGDIDAEVIAIMPPQQAGAIAHSAGLTAGADWCPVDSHTFQSVLYPQVYVLGDANDAAPNEKTAFTAAQQADRFVRAVAGVFA